MSDEQKSKLQQELISNFIIYVHRLENPYPSELDDFKKLVEKYQKDSLFHAKVMSLFDGVMCTIEKYI